MPRISFTDDTIGEIQNIRYTLLNKICQKAYILPKSTIPRLRVFLSDARIDTDRQNGLFPIKIKIFHQ